MSSSETWVIALLVRGLVLASVVALVALPLRRASAAIRHRVWAFGAIGLLALPLLSAVLPDVGVPILESRSRREPSAVATAPLTHARPVAPGREEATDSRRDGTPRSATMERGGPEVALATRPPTDSEARVSEATPSVPGTAEGLEATVSAQATANLWWVWFAGALLALLPGAIGVARVRLTTRRARAVVAPDAARELEAACRAHGLAAPSLLESDAVESPVAGGILHPAILLPRAARGWSRERIRLVLLHEVAHVARRDLLVERLARLGVALHWMNPLAWLALRGLRRESERACDDAVLVAGAAPADYADCLVSLAHGPIAAGALPMARQSSLESRVRAILGDPARRTTRLGRPAGLSSMALGLTALVAVAALRPSPRAAAEDAPPAPPAFDVALDGTARFKTLQAAIDAAKPGEKIRVGPGTFDGPVFVAKPLTIVGAGADQTTLVADVSMDKVENFRDAAAVEAAIRPTLRVDVEGEVTVADLSLVGRAEWRRGATRVDAIVLVRRANARFERCALWNSGASGLIAGTDAAVVLDHCLVAALGSEGVVARRAKRLTLSDCDVRDCVHYGISIVGPVEATIERCRISGSLWHGIRVDDGAAVIRGNVIFDIERSGIYVNSDTACTIEDNLFLDNVMSGVSCWQQRSHDTIRRNTFANTQREGVALLGGSRALVEGNVFVGNATAVMGAGIGGRETQQFSGPMRIARNWFWKNERTATQPASPPADGGAQPVEVPWETLAADGNVKADPGFADAAHKDFSLPEKSAARLAGVGVAAPLSTKSPWPLRPEEPAWRENLAKERMPRGPVVRAPAGTAPSGSATAATASPYALAKPWIDGLHSLTDAAGRAAAVQHIKDALASDDAVQNHAAFVAIAGTSDVVWDRAALREAILPRLAKAKGAAQVSGFCALFISKGRPEDVDLLLGALATPSPEMIEDGSHLLFLFTKGEIEGKAADALLRLLDRDDPRALRDVMRGIWGARVSPPVEARLLALAATKDASLYHDVVYFALSTLRDKSPAVVAELGRAAASPDPNNAWRAAWGLSSGVAVAAQVAAADLLMALLELRSNPQTRESCLRGLSDYGTPAHAKRLEALRDGGALDAQAKDQVDGAIRRIRGRGGK